MTLGKKQGNEGKGQVLINDHLFIPACECDKGFWRHKMLAAGAPHVGLGDSRICDLSGPWGPCWPPVGSHFLAASARRPACLPVCFLRHHVFTPSTSTSSHPALLRASLTLSAGATLTLSLAVPTPLPGPHVP